MIRTLRLQNFKGFLDHTIEFETLSILSGRNNAGKSSAIEAMRVIATVRKKYSGSRLKFRSSPSWVPVTGVGLTFETDDLQLMSETVFHKYSTPPAILVAVFDDGTSLTVYIGPEQCGFAIMQTNDGVVVETAGLARQCTISQIRILPQISPLSESETVLKHAYVTKCLETHLASRHFRNQIRYLNEHFDDFCTVVNSTWDGVRVSGFDDFSKQHGDTLNLMLSDQGFVAEAANFGHGLQMWLQIVWFVVRASPQDIVVMDEPDVYMHPEQQTALIQMLRGRFKQCVLSTHAVTIIDACANSEVLELDKRLPRTTARSEVQSY